MIIDHLHLCSVELSCMFYEEFFRNHRKGVVVVLGFMQDSLIQRQRDTRETGRISIVIQVLEVNRVRSSLEETLTNGLTIFFKYQRR